MNTHRNTEAVSVQNSAYTDFLGSFFTLQQSFDGSSPEDDITTSITVTDPTKERSATIVAREPLRVAGVEELQWWMQKSPLAISWNVQDGQDIKPGTMGTLTGSLADILLYERTLLNVLQRMCGIATFTASLTRDVPDETLICATRKTLWGPLDKKAVLLGGGGTHRLSLSDAILIKDNHIATAASFRSTLLAALEADHKNARFFEVEVDTEEQLQTTLECFAEVPETIPRTIMLDNFSPERSAPLIKKIQSQNVLVELSGGINEKNLAGYVAVGPDIISMGCLTNTARSTDIGLDF